MDAAALIGELRRAGVELKPDGDRLLFRPRSAVTPEQLEQLAEHKLELIALLSPGPDRTPPYRCIRCGQPVALTLRLAGDMWTYRCRCGNRSKVAVRDYEKLQLFEDAQRR